MSNNNDPKTPIAPAFDALRQALSRAVPEDYAKLIQQEQAMRAQMRKDSGQRTLSEMFNDVSEEEAMSQLDADYMAMKKEADDATKKRETEQKALVAGRFPPPPMKETT